MNKYLWLVLLFTALTSTAQTSYKFRISLTDKKATTYSLSKPEEFLSAKAIERRIKQQLSVDSTDLPVCRLYEQTIEAQGVRVVARGKWENFVTVACGQDTAVIALIARLPFVRHTERVWTARNDSSKLHKIERDLLDEKKIRKQTDRYGLGRSQLSISGGDKLHEAGFCGQGMTIGVIDAGFHNVDLLKHLKNVKILGTCDFVAPESDIYAESNHGLKVLSCMAMNAPHVMIGSAPKASYWLLRSEDEESEHLVEQDYFAAALEFADSVGCDVVNTSLGYYDFDDDTKDYQLRNVDGHFALMSRQANRAVDKGMLFVCSAGNSGDKTWKKITPPADAENVLAVGAVDKKGVLAPFSSVGTTADGRIKPDVVAVGLFTDVLSASGQMSRANGTSFASPIMCGMVTCLWQALPQLTAKELLSLLRRSGDRATYPDNIYGYGVPDLWKAYQQNKTP